MSESAKYSSFSLCSSNADTDTEAFEESESNEALDPQKMPWASLFKDFLTYLALLVLIPVLCQLYWMRHLKMQDKNTNTVECQTYELTVVPAFLVCLAVILYQLHSLRGTGTNSRDLERVSVRSQTGSESQLLEAALRLQSRVWSQGLEQDETGKSEQSGNENRTVEIPFWQIFAVFAIIAILAFLSIYSMLYCPVTWWREAEEMYFQCKDVCFQANITDNHHSEADQCSGMDSHYYEISEKDMKQLSTIQTECYVRGLLKKPQCEERQWVRKYAEPMCKHCTGTKEGVLDKCFDLLKQPTYSEVTELFYEGGHYFLAFEMQLRKYLQICSTEIYGTFVSSTLLALLIGSKLAIASNRYLVERSKGIFKKENFESNVENKEENVDIANVVFKQMKIKHKHYKTSIVLGCVLALVRTAIPGLCRIIPEIGGRKNEFLSLPAFESGLLVGMFYNGFVLVCVMAEIYVSVQANENNLHRLTAFDRRWRFPGEERPQHAPRSPRAQEPAPVDSVRTNGTLDSSQNSAVSSQAFLVGDSILKADFADIPREGGGLWYNLPKLQSWLNYRIYIQLDNIDERHRCELAVILAVAFLLPQVGFILANLVTLSRGKYQKMAIVNFVAFFDSLMILVFILKALSVTLFLNNRFDEHRAKLQALQRHVALHQVHPSSAKLNDHYSAELVRIHGGTQNTPPEATSSASSGPQLIYPVNDKSGNPTYRSEVIQPKVAEKYVEDIKLSLELTDSPAMLFGLKVNKVFVGSVGSTAATLMMGQLLQVKKFFMDEIAE